VKLIIIRAREDLLMKLKVILLGVLSYFILDVIFYMLGFDGKYMTVIIGFILLCSAGFITLVLERKNNQKNT